MMRVKVPLCGRYDEKGIFHGAESKGSGRTGGHCHKNRGFQFGKGGLSHGKRIRDSSDCK